MRKVSRHIFHSEAVCHCGKCNRIDLKAPIAFLFDRTREILGRPIRINSAFRCQEYQAELRRQGSRAAIISPHTFGWALDCDIPEKLTAEELAVIFENTATALEMEIPRLGFKKYNGKFLHVDLVFYGYEPFTNIPNPKTELWKPKVKW